MSHKLENSGIMLVDHHLKLKQSFVGFSMPLAINDLPFTPFQVYDDPVPFPPVITKFPIYTWQSKVSPGLSLDCWHGNHLELMLKMQFPGPHLNPTESETLVVKALLPHTGLNKWAVTFLIARSLEVSTRMLIVALLIISKIWEQSKCPLVGEWINKPWSFIQWCTAQL